MNNKYYKRSRISEAKFRHLIKCFSLGSVTVIFDKLRKKIARWSEQLAPFGGTVEVDESYFGPRRIPGKRGRGASGKTIVFGIFKRQGQVYTEIVPDARKNPLQRVISGKVDLKSIIHSDGWRGYDGLADAGYDKHYRVNHGQDEYADGSCHINGIELFWSFAKRRLALFNGVPKKSFTVFERNRIPF